LVAAWGDPGMLRRAAEPGRGEPVHGVLRAGPQRVLQRPADRSRAPDQGRQCPPGRPAGRVGLVRPAPSERRRPDRPPPAGPGPQVVARAWAAQLRRCGRFRRLATRKTSKNLAVAAVARELAGFWWAEMTA